MPELTWLAAFLIFILIALPWMSIFQKAGYSRWLGLLWLVPVANVIIILLLAFSDWPVHRQMRYFKMQSGEALDEDIYEVLGDAFRLERKGQFEAAMEKYQEIATRFSDRPPGQDAGNYIQSLRAKMEGTGCE